MSSTEKLHFPPPPPPPPPPPSPLPSNLREKSLLNPGKISLSYNENHNGKQKEDGENFPKIEDKLGQVEIKEITEENFLSEVNELINSRLLGETGVTEMDNGSQSLTKLAVTMPLKKAFLQSGPMCGIVALAEALHILNETEVHPKIILEKAIKLGYTKQGEMFSIKAMQSLAENIGGCSQTRILNTETGQGQVTEVIHHLLQGFPILVPYDADYNHSPALRKGHAAHWTVIYGIASYVPTEKLDIMLRNCQEAFDILKSSPETIIVKSSSNILNSPLAKELLSLINYKSLHVIAHQGKSFHPALWTYKALLESNQNLIEFAPKILANKSEYIFESIEDGLCSQILLLK